ncbi:MAG: tyrosine decarboxylase MfnA [Candidatus Thermoplasmatota archaeon]|nr:tyrosine decarboxylase MfnA [Candidatus Thermoplasmatota archaeon]
MMLQKGLEYDDVISEVEKALSEDFHFEDGKILGSMCTQPLDVAIDTHGMFIESNLGNPGLYPGTRRLEGKIVEMMGELLNGKGVTGRVLEGGTEANLTALWIARNLTGRKEVILGSNAHFSIRKACDILKMMPREVDVDENHVMDVGEVEKHIGDDTAAVVATAGTTEFGLVDPIDKLSEVCKERTWFHVDAAWGGFILPFLDDAPAFDFSNAGLSSMNADGHKMGMSTIPSAVFLLRKEEDLQNIAFESPYLTSVFQTTVLGTRASAGVPSLYATMMSMGRDGYRENVENCMSRTRQLTRAVKDMGLSLVTEPVTNILAVKLRDPVGVKEHLERRGWHLSLTKHPEALRLVVMPHATEETLNVLIEDMISACREMGEI